MWILKKGKIKYVDDCGKKIVNFQITWVLTSYIVSSAIFMPLTGFLVKRLGRKRLLLMNIVGFMTASIFFIAFVPSSLNRNVTP